MTSVQIDTPPLPAHNDTSTIFQMAIHRKDKKLLKSRPRKQHYQMRRDRKAEVKRYFNKLKRHFRLCGLLSVHDADSKIMTALHDLNAIFSPLPAYPLNPRRETRRLVRSERVDGEVTLNYFEYLNEDQGQTNQTTRSEIRPSGPHGPRSDNQSLEDRECKLNTWLTDRTTDQTAQNPGVHDFRFAD